MHSIIDSHTHAWDSECNLTTIRRYTPTQEHTYEMLLSSINKAGVKRAVLVQPSFLGTDNSYLLRQLEKSPESLRGVVVVEPDIEESKFGEMVKKGVTGVRLNILGSSITGKELVEKNRNIINLIRIYKCHLEIQTSGDHWDEILFALMKENITVVVDHFGLPGSSECLGFKSILKHLASGRLWVKLSGWYRFDANSVNLTQKLIQIAPEHLVWGSDYPWTQNEDGRTYESCTQKLGEWCNKEYHEKILTKNPEKLFKFNNVVA